MAQKRWIARTGRGLIDGLALLLRRAGVLCAALGTLFFTLLSYHEASDNSSEYGEAMPDGLSPMEREEVARSEGWKSW